MRHYLESFSKGYAAAVAVAAAAAAAVSERRQRSRCVGGSRYSRRHARSFPSFSHTSNHGRATPETRGRGAAGGA